MEQFSTLVKKQLTEEMSFAKRKKRPDVLGIFLSLFLAAVFVAAVAYIFTKFIPVYTSVTFNYVYDPLAREYEVLTVVYACVLIAGVISAVRNLNNGIFENDDMKIFVYLPVKSSAYLAAQLVGSYLKSLLTTVLIVVPVNLTFGIVSGATPYYGFMTVALCLVLPLINISVATLFVLPAYYIKKFLGGKYVLSLIILVAFLGLVFWGYSTVLNTLKALLVRREISLVFNNETMTVIVKAVSLLYPANLLANIMLRREMLFSALVLFGGITVFGASGFFITKKMLADAMRQRYQNGARYVFKSGKKPAKESSVFAALLRKEFFNVLRVPSYAFQYFATSLIMPLMVYFSLSILISLVKSLLFIDCSFELCIFVISIFSVLTNTFCATNISRDGVMFFQAKTMPFTHKQIVFSKIVFCACVSVVSLLACAVTVACLGYVSAAKAVFIFFVTLCLSLSQIAYATRMDFNHPHFSLESNGEIKESNSTVSTIIVLGLLFSVLIGGVSLMLSLLTKLGYFEIASDFTTYLIVGGCALVLLGFGIFYLLKGLDKKYYEEETSL